MTFNWNGGAHDRLASLCKGGATASEIAEILSREFGPVSRNAVIGRVTRSSLRFARKQGQNDGVPKKNAPEWPPEIADHVRRLVADGRSSNEVRDIVNSTYGQSVTRMAVLGRVARMGMKFASVVPMSARDPDWKETIRKKVRAGATRQEILASVDISDVHLTRFFRAEGLSVRHRPKRKAAITFAGPDAAHLIQPEPKPPREIVHETAPDDAVDFLDLKFGQCRWPYGERAPFRFCGCKVKDGSSYCASHHAASVTKAPPKPLKPVFDIHSRPAPRRTVFA